jgi:hypothetical protein
MEIWLSEMVMVMVVDLVINGESGDLEWSRIW